jgi:tungstate transport system ATP-binding protein
MSPLFVLRHVVMRYNARTILSIDDLRIDEGETLALIGPSGAGKSTLLRLLCFLEHPSAGSITYASCPITAMPSLAIRREITLVFQRPLLLDTTVWRNVAYGLKLRGRRDDALIAATLDQLGLGDLAQARALKLSGGEMQRVALARALVLQPRVLLLDEPTANLDPRNVAIMEWAIMTLQQQGTTIVLATHQLHQARRLGTRAALLLDGQLVEVGSVKQIFNAPADRRTRAFMSGEIVY